MPAPVSAEVLSAWLPSVKCQQSSGETVLFLHVGCFDLESLNSSGFARRDLLLFCEESLRQLQKEASSIMLVADLQGVNLAHLNSQWWKVAMPQLLDLLSESFPGFLRQVLVVRASRVSGAAAQRLLDRHGIPSLVQVGHEVGALELLEARGLARAAECFFRDPKIDAVQMAENRRTGEQRGRRLRRVVILLLLAMLLLFVGFVLGAGAATLCSSFSALHLLLQASFLVLLATVLKRRKACQALASRGLSALGSPKARPKVKLPDKSVVAERRKDAWWPELNLGASGELRFAARSAVNRSRAVPPIEGDGRELLSRLMEISGACQKVQPGTKQTVGNMVIQRIVHKEHCAVWSAQVGTDPVMFVASQVVLATPEPPEAVLWALYSAEERLKWDGGSFSAYEVLGDPQVQEATGALCDFLYCRIHLVTGVTDRDMVQERFLLRLADRGYAIAIRACSDGQSRALGRAPVSSVVRARTIISGYIIQPNPSGAGVLVTGVSQTDLGGNVPLWFQGLVKKAGRRKPVEWAQRLEDHCNMRAGLDVASGRGRLTFSALRSKARGWTKELAQSPCFPRDGATTRRSRPASPTRASSSHQPQPGRAQANSL